MGMEMAVSGSRPIERCGGGNGGWSAARLGAGRGWGYVGEHQRGPPDLCCQPRPFCGNVRREDANTDKMTGNGVGHSRRLALVRLGRSWLPSRRAPCLNMAFATQCAATAL